LLWRYCGLNFVIFGEKTAARLACVRDSLVKYVTEMRVKSFAQASRHQQLYALPA